LVWLFASIHPLSLNKQAFSDGLTSTQADEKQEEAEARKLQKKKDEKEKALRQISEAKETDKKKQEHAQVLSRCEELYSLILGCVLANACEIACCCVMGDCSMLHHSKGMACRRRGMQPWPFTQQRPRN
jgi:hypothetical protein